MISQGTVLGEGTFAYGSFPDHALLCLLLLIVGGCSTGRRIRHLLVLAFILLCCRHPATPPAHGSQSARGISCHCAWAGGYMQACIPVPRLHLTMPLSSAQQIVIVLGHSDDELVCMDFFFRGGGGGGGEEWVAHRDATHTADGCDMSLGACHNSKATTQRLALICLNVATCVNAAQSSLWCNHALHGSKSSCNTSCDTRQWHVTNILLRADVALGRRGSRGCRLGGGSCCRSCCCRCCCTIHAHVSSCVSRASSCIIRLPELNTPSKL